MKIELRKCAMIWLVFSLGISDFTWTSFNRCSTALGFAKRPINLSVISTSIDNRPWLDYEQGNDLLSLKCFQMPFLLHNRILYLYFL